uniref:Uncharacterized protein n=1 Tax=Oryza brachyantha TaxID=4533 RepID=J3MYP8_ORYBR
MGPRLRAAPPDQTRTRDAELFADRKKVVPFETLNVQLLMLMSAGGLLRVQPQLKSKVKTAVKINELTQRVAGLPCEGRHGPPAAAAAAKRLGPEDPQ